MLYYLNDEQYETEEAAIDAAIDYLTEKAEENGAEEILGVDLWTYNGIIQVEVVYEVAMPVMYSGWNGHELVDYEKIKHEEYHDYIEIEVYYDDELDEEEQFPFPP